MLYVGVAVVIVGFLSMLLAVGKQRWKAQPAEVPTRQEGPQKACHECWESYTLTEWAALESVSEQTPPTGNAAAAAALKQRVERRKCWRCGAVMALDVEHAKQIRYFVEDAQ